MDVCKYRHRLKVSSGTSRERGLVDCTLGLWPSSETGAKELQSSATTSEAGAEELLSSATAGVLTSSLHLGNGIKP